jgi:hypothetical protein
MPAIVELTPLTQRGHAILEELETNTGLVPLRTDDASGAKTYYVEGWSGVEGFQAALDRTDPTWVRYVTFRDLSRTA